MGKARRLRQAAAESNVVIGMRFAAVADANDAVNMQHAQKITHDQVILDTGTARLTGVRWHIIDATKAAPVLDGMAAEPDPSGRGVQSEHYEQLRQYLADNPRGALVIATVEYDLQRFRAGLS